jgi:hypothetical protein
MNDDTLPSDGDRVMVDFDNTLTTGDCRYWEGERPEPDENVVDWARSRYHAGATVIIWTARPWSEAGQIAAHCTEWGLPFHGIRCEKGSADMYVDDKAVHPTEVTDT